MGPRSTSDRFGRYQQTSLGGIVPPGVEVKRWGPQNNRPAHSPTTVGTPGVGRGKPPRQFQPQGTPPHQVQSQGTPPAMAGSGRGAPRRGPHAGIVRHLFPHARVSAPMPVSTRPSTGIGPVLYQEADLLIKFVVEPGAKEERGQFSLFTSSSLDAVIWELRAHGPDGKEVRGDLRHCLPLAPFGTTLHLRRQEAPQSPVVSSQITCPSIMATQRLVNQVNRHRGIAEPTRGRTPQEPLAPNAGDAAADPDEATRPSDNAQTDTREAPNETSPATLLPQPPAALLEESSQLIDFSPSKSPPPAKPSEPPALYSLLTLGDDLDRPELPEVSDDSGFLSDNLIALDDHKVFVAGTKVEQSPRREINGVNPYVRASTIGGVSRCYRLDVIERIAEEEDLTGVPQKILSELTSQDYALMTQMSHKLLEIYEWAQTFPAPDQPKQAFLDIATLRLEREDDFVELHQHDQKRLIAKVYRRIMNTRIVRPAEQMIALRGEVQSTEGAVRGAVQEFNNYLEGNRWCISPRTPKSPRPGPQRYGSPDGPRAIRGDTTKSSTIEPTPATQGVVQGSGTPQITRAIGGNGTQQGESSQPRHLRFDDSTTRILPHLRRGLTGSRWAVDSDSAQENGSATEKSYGPSPPGDLSSLSGIVKGVGKIWLGDRRRS